MKTPAGLAQKLLKPLKSRDQRVAETTQSRRIASVLSPLFYRSLFGAISTVVAWLNDAIVAF